MELKEMENTAVVVNTEEEAEELRGYYSSHGWPFPKAPLISEGRAMYVLVGKGNLSWFASDNYNGRVLITLAQFKERNGIVKWKQDDVLVNDHNERKILGICGGVYFPSRTGDFTVAHGEAWTEKQLSGAGYTLKTDEPEMVELTLEDVAKLHGSPVEQIRIKEKE